MPIDWQGFTPLAALAGGLLIGIAALMFAVLAGRVAGISGILGGLLHPACQLPQGELCVGDLEETTGIHQPTLSQQLGVLRAEGLAATRREGKQIFYSLADPGTLEVLRILYHRYFG